MLEDHRIYFGFRARWLRVDFGFTLLLALRAG